MRGLPFLVALSTVFMAQNKPDVVQFFAMQWLLFLSVFLGLLATFGRGRIALAIFGDENYYLRLIQEATEDQECIYNYLQEEGEEEQE